MVDCTVEVITALITRCVNKAKKRNCDACLKYLPNQSDHPCATQTTNESVQLYFDDAYNAVGINLINAVFVMDGHKPPPLDMQAVKDHHRGEIRQKLQNNLDTLTSGDLRVARCIVYMQPLFQFFA